MKAAHWAGGGAWLGVSPPHPSAPPPQVLHPLPEGRGGRHRGGVGQGRQRRPRLPEAGQPQDGGPGPLRAPPPPGPPPGPPQPCRVPAPPGRCCKPIKQRPWCRPRALSQWVSRSGRGRGTRLCPSPGVRHRGTRTGTEPGPGKEPPRPGPPPSLTPDCGRRSARR